MENNLNLPPFYVGQKVAFKKHDNLPYEHGVIAPKKGEVLTISGRFDDDNYYFIKEYPNQVFHKKSLIPIQEQKLPLITYKKVLEEVPVAAN